MLTLSPLPPFPQLPCIQQVSGEHLLRPCMVYIDSNVNRVKVYIDSNVVNSKVKQVNKYTSTW